MAPSPSLVVARFTGAPSCSWRREHRPRVDCGLEWKLALSFPKAPGRPALDSEISHACCSTQEALSLPEKSSTCEWAAKTPT